MIYADPSLNVNAVSALVSSLSERAKLCVKILDAEGTVLAVNRRGLVLMGRSAEEVCGQPWLALWLGEHFNAAEAALDQTLDGAAARFIAEAGGETGQATWEVELFPCDWRDGRVSRVAVIATPLAGPGAAEEAAEGLKVVTALREMLHAVANLASVTTSAANLLRRGLDEDRAEVLAASLEETGEAAAKAVQDLRAMILPQTPDESA